MNKVLSHPIWLKLLTQRHYVVIFLNSEGKKVFSTEILPDTKFSHLAKHLSEYSIFEIFDIPTCQNLNSFFEKNENLDLESMMNAQNLYDISLPETKTWFIKPLRRKIDRLVHYYSIIPTSNIKVFRINSNLFAGIISIPSGSDEISDKLSNRLAIMVDSNHRITGYNGLFNHILNVSDNTSLLGQHITNYIKFSNNPFFSDVSGIPPIHKNHLTLDWYKELTGKNIKLNNFHNDKYASFYLEKEIDVNENDIDIEISYDCDNGDIPNIVMRAMTESDNGFIDDYGYSLVRIDNNTLGFKRAGKWKFQLDISKHKKSFSNTILWCKRGWCHTIFYNDIFIAKWYETTPFTVKSDNLIALFLRKKEKNVLHNAKVRFHPSESPSTLLPSSNIIASILTKNELLHFNITFDQSFIAYQNTLTYYLENITDFSRQLEKLRKEKDKLKRLLNPLPEFIGESESIKNIKRQIHLIAKSNLTVIIEGETGVGKEIVAKAIHESSSRKNSSFVKLDCSTLPQNLIESELFGHEKGAFTGATSSRAGRFELANGGTLFIDEISNLALEAQAKLLQVIQDLKVQRIGGNVSKPIDIRIIAASNQSLQKMVKEGKFRSDLFFRLNQFIISIPPLRERQKDIPPLSLYFLNEANRHLNREFQGIEASAFDKLCNASWLGNVRELRNAIFRAALTSDSSLILASDIILEPVTTAARNSMSKARHKWKKEEILDAINKSNNNVTDAAKLLSISRVMIYRLINKFDIQLTKLRNLNYDTKN